MNTKRKIVCSLLSLLMILGVMSGCSYEENSDDGAERLHASEADEVSESDEDSTWAVYWYLCGSDLESQGGAATSDLEELLSVQLPENVQVIIQTGGASAWQNEMVNPDASCRFLYNSEGLEQIEENPEANMGDPATLADFLSFCSENYPADRAMMTFWNHGGGSVSGAAFDELHENDSLSLTEMGEAFSQVYGSSPEDLPFEVVGFDTCLMATVDTASTFTPFSHFLVASEELEPGCGWNYTGWVQALADAPGMTGDQLGTAICDSYVEGCEAVECADDITLSCIDLTKVDDLLVSYDNLGMEALSAACADPLFFAEFGRSASRSENYGGNTPDEGYSNMVDLGHLVRNSTGLLPENSQAILDALEECVTYRVNGPYRQEATGLSCYYSFNGDVEDYSGYANLDTSEAFKYLYGYAVEGQLSEEGLNYVTEIGYEKELQPLPAVDEEALEDFPLTVDENANSTMSIGADNAALLASVYFQLFYINPDDDSIIMLGRDNDIDADWENGVFKDNFRGVWGAIDGNLCYMDITYEGDDYNLYAVPIMLNGEEYNLRVAYSFTDSKYSILGARKGLDDTGMADKNLVQLKPGDEITTLHYTMSISGDDTEFVQLPLNTFKVTEQTSFAETDLGDGTFGFIFEMTDMSGESCYSQMATFTVEKGTIYTNIE